jgi:3-oxoacyl-[acyl-carrier protein] reductase
VSDAESVAAGVDDVLARTGRIDVVVNNAGILRDRVVWKLTDADWQAVIGVHLTGTFNMTRAAIPAMCEQGYGRFVNVTSYTGLHGNVGQANYAAAKAGVIGFTRTTAKELARFGITVNAISPNAETDMVASIPQDRFAELTAQIPMGRFASPTEVAPAVAFLASEEAGYITGVVLPVDGGLSI